MKKSFVVLALGSPAILWLVGKISVRLYKMNPSLFNFIAQDILIPQVKNLITDLVMQSVYRAVYGETYRGTTGPVGYGATNYVPYNRPINTTPAMKHIPYDRVSERRRYARY